MKIKIIATTIITVLSLFSAFSTAISANENYAGIQYAFGKYTEDGLKKVESNVLVGRFGQYINNDFAIEGRLGIGLEEDSINVSGREVFLDIDTFIGVYGLYPVNRKDTSMYGLLGFTRGESVASGLGIFDVSYGVGLKNNLNGISASFEYIQYLNKSGVNFSAVSLDFVIEF